MKFYESTVHLPPNVLFCKVDLNDFVSTFSSWTSEVEMKENDEVQFTKQKAGDWFNNPIYTPETWSEITFEKYTQMKREFYNILDDHDKPLLT